MSDRSRLPVQIVTPKRLIALVQRGIDCGLAEGDANAAHIVRCVNTHDQLVTAVRMALDDSEIMAPDGRPMCVTPDTLQALRAALAAAKAGV